MLFNEPHYIHHTIGQGYYGFLKVLRRAHVCTCTFAGNLIRNLLV